MPTFKILKHINKALEMKMSNYLEIDSKILEKNLLLENSPASDNLENFFRPLECYAKDNTAWIYVTPTAGFCVKTTDSEQKKVFINICKLNEIPEPKDITETELLELWHSDDIPDFKISLSIQEPRDDFDKSGNPAVAYDVAVNTKFFQKIESSLVFRSFTMQVILEALENKYNVELKKDDYVVLKNKKCLGELKPHRIRKSKVSSAPSRPLIEELNSTRTPSESEIDSKVTQKTPEFRIFEDTRDNIVVGEFHLPCLVTPKDLVLSVNENRIVLDHRRGLYFTDLFIPLKVDENKTTSSFNTNTKILSVLMPKISTDGLIPC